MHASQQPCSLECVSVARSFICSHAQGLATQSGTPDTDSEWRATLAGDALDAKLVMPLDTLPKLYPFKWQRRRRTLPLRKPGPFQLPPPNILPQSRTQALLDTDPPPRVEAPHSIHGTAAIWKHGRLIWEQLRELRLEVVLEAVVPSTAAITRIAASARLLTAFHFHRAPHLKYFREETARAAIVHVLGDAGVSSVSEYEIAGFLRKPEWWSNYYDRRLRAVGRCELMCGRSAGLPGV